MDKALSMDKASGQCINYELALTPSLLKLKVSKPKNNLKIVWLIIVSTKIQKKFIQQSNAKLFATVY